MTIPIYSNLKAKLEAKGLDTITSGQIAWLSTTTIPSIFLPCFAICYLLFDVFNSRGYWLAFFGSLLIIFPPSLFILLSLHFRFLIMNLVYIVAFVLFSVLIHTNVLRAYEIRFILGSIFYYLSLIYPFVWFFIKRMSLGYRVLLFFLYEFIMFIIAFIFMAYNGLISK